MTRTSITSGQEKQYARLVEDAAAHAAQLGLKKGDLDRLALDRLLSRGNELKTAITEVVVAKTRELSVTDRFADEEKSSRFGYLSGYTVPRSLADQLGRLGEFFPDLHVGSELLPSGEPPHGVEGYFAIPRWEKIAPTYGEAVQKVLDLIKQTRHGKFYNYREGQLGPQHLQQHPRTVEKLQELEEHQAGYGDFLVIAAQFALRHRGRSIRRAREVFSAHEFGLGAYHVGIMLLTHPERLQHYDDLWIDCAGDEFAPGADGDFVHAPCFLFSGGQVEFVTRYVDCAGEGYGSASGFLPQ